ncbi:MAG: tetratricopeptide repeat protein, partial [Magnetococcales bacterium]|nr:tetratricopeptide repeat protein [Magnetococcales bacterium]
MAAIENFSMQSEKLFASALTKHRQGNLVAAVADYELFLRHFPDHLFALTNLAIALHFLQQPMQAEKICRRALAIQPGHGEAWNNLGIILGGQQRYEEAIAAYQRCVTLDPAHDLAWNNLGLALSRLDRVEEAVAAFAQSLAIRPEHVEALTQFIYHKMQLCDWQGLDVAITRLQRLSRLDAGEINPFLMLFICRDPVETFRVAVNYGQRVSKAAGAPPTVAGVRHGPLRKIGYLSADFHPHATTALVSQLFESHDHHRYEIFAYSSGPADDSPVRQRIVQSCHLFREVGHLTDQQIADLIRADGIDILVDLKGYTRDARSQVLARRPSPLQINFLGYPGTMGTPFMDYIVADQTVLPPAHLPYFSEKPLWMPHTYQINDSHRFIHPHAPSRKQVGLPEEGFVFCCFNQSVKITPDIFEIWMYLLQKIPNSVLWLMAFHPYAMKRLRFYAETANVDPTRLVFAPRWPLDRHLSRYGLADLFLDTLPCNAHTTASDALWAGCPVLTCPGAT